MQFHGKGFCEMPTLSQLNPSGIYLQAGALLACGIVNSGVRNECDPALALLFDHVTHNNSYMRIGAILGWVLHIWSMCPCLSHVTCVVWLACCGMFILFFFSFLGYPPPLIDDQPLLSSFLVFSCYVFPRLLFLHVSSLFHMALQMFI